MLINDIMRNRQRVCCRAVCAQRHSLKYKGTSFAQNEAEINRRMPSMKLCEDSKLTVKDRLEPLTEADAHGGSLVARLKFHSFFMAFNQLHSLDKKKTKHAKRLVNEIQNKSRQRIKSSKSASEHEEADSAYHQQISGLS